MSSSRSRSRSRIRAGARNWRWSWSRSQGAGYSYKDGRDCWLAGAEGKEQELLLRDAEVEGGPQQLALQVIILCLLGVGVMEHLDPSNHSGNNRVSLLSLYILSFWSLTLLLLPLLSLYLLSCSKNKLNKNRAKLLDLNLKIPRKECAIFNTPNFCVQLPKHQQTNQQTNQPTNQPTKYRAFQISFVGLGGQGKS